MRKAPSPPYGPFIRLGTIRNKSLLRVSGDWPLWMAA
jgi:hypothetical protein